MNLTGNTQRSTRYQIECYGPDGKLKWSDGFNNLVVDEGLNDCLERQFKARNYTAAWYVGLTGDNPIFVPSDTMCYHPLWVEDTHYNDYRPALVMGDVNSGSVSNQDHVAEFNINSTAQIGGAFIVSSKKKGSREGVLYSGGALDEGSQWVMKGDRIMVLAILTVTAAPNLEGDEE